MTFDLKRMLASKDALRRKLAGRPLAEKLAMLDALRERALALREAAGSLRHTAVREDSEKYRAEQNPGKHLKQ